MDLNRFLPCDSVAPHHGVLLAPDFTKPDQYAGVQVVYSGPLKGLTEELLAKARITLVHPGTLASVKAKLEDMGEGDEIVPTLEEAHAAALKAAVEFENRASYEETLWTGWGEQTVPFSATMRREKAQQAVAALEAADLRFSSREVD